MAEAKLSRELQTALNAINHATDGIRSEELLWHPEGKWSSAEILEHLALAFGRTTDRMKILLKEKKLDVRSRTFREWVGGVIVLKLGRIPPGRKAPEAISPKGVAPEQAMASIRENLAELDRVIGKCQRIFGTQKNVMEHAVLGPLSTNEWLRFHCVHTQHHMRQIKRLRQSSAIAKAAAGKSL